MKVDDKVDIGEATKEPIPNGFENKKPALEKEASSGSNLEEYGYGFWARFLTVYP